ncbi:MAG: indolepyruvate oxidoreductase subunit beta family protein [Alphaproteobacteria bacterium]
MDAGGNPETPRPVTALVGALGGEGGGVLAAWLVGAARHAGLPVQSTSIPGVAQRTGATTYYVEIFPVPLAQLGGREPVLALYPGLGDVDLVVASELVEAARACQRGFVTPDRTTLVASTHRVYAMGERTAAGDGRFDQERLLATVRGQSRRAVLGDMAAVAQREGVPVNALLLGAIAGAGVLPLREDDFTAAIQDGGVAVDLNLRGLTIGLAAVREGRLPQTAAADEQVRPRRWTVADAEARLVATFPDAVQDLAREGVRRVAHFQDAAYAQAYLDRLARVRDVEASTAGMAGWTVTREAARHLALRMAWDDVIRVAQIKSAPGRAERLRAEVRAAAHEPVRITEFFRPGLEEVVAVLPRGLGRRLRAFGAARRWNDRPGLALPIRTTSVGGYLALWCLARLRPLRRASLRWTEEQAAIDAWVADIVAAQALGWALALEVVLAAGLLKGYGDTWRRGERAFARLRVEVVAPALAGRLSPSLAADALANARAALRTDPEGKRLDEVLAGLPARA